MDTIFLDTSIFEGQNFLESKQIKTLYSLAEDGHIHVIIPKLTYDEIIRRIEQNVEDANRKFKKYRNDTRVLRNAPSLIERLEPFNVEDIKQEIVEKVKEQFKLAGFEIIDYPVIDIESIFQSYFNKVYPFSSGGKKAEFPDAFALKIVEDYGIKNNVKVLLFSSDNDMLNYSNDNIEIMNDFSKYLNDKIKDIDKKKAKLISDIENILSKNPKRIIDEVKEWVEYELDDFSIYYDYTNGYDVHDFDISDVKVKIKEFNTTFVNDYEISVQLKVEIEYEVEVTTDDENSLYYDHGKEEYSYLDTELVLVEKTKIINVDLTFDIQDDNSVSEPFIESINNGQKLIS